ncbi:helix-turn-helix domain-containing protein [Alcaligenaceae bacterium SJ-26]|nr:helix-turn-helix domain-containing protein [Alcaligenaceae bacterium SJ-26]
MEHPIDTASRSVGSAACLARKLGVTKAAVWQWKLPGRQVPVEHCLSIERMTNGSVTRRSLRPNDYWTIWPDLVCADTSLPLSVHPKEPTNV